MAIKKANTINKIEIKNLKFFSTKITKKRNAKKRNNDVLSPLKKIIHKDIIINKYLNIEFLFINMLIKNKITGINLNA